MTIFFADGFETANISRWTTSTGTPTVVTSPVHHGGYACQFDLETAENVRVSLTGGTVFFIRQYCFWDGVLSANGVGSFIYIRDSAFNPLFRVGIDTTGGHNFYVKIGNSAANYYDHPAYAINTWYCVEGEYNADTDVHHLWIDGKLVLTIADAETAAVAGAYIGNIERTNTNANNITIDCVVYANRRIGTEFLLHRTPYLPRHRNTQFRRNDPNPYYPTYPPL